MSDPFFVPTLLAILAKCQKQMLECQSKCLTIKPSVRQQKPGASD
jgi:hypothetical protein